MQFAQTMLAAVPRLSAAVRNELDTALRSGGARLPVKMQVAIEAPGLFMRAERNWQQKVRDCWIKAGVGAPRADTALPASGTLELMDDSRVEGKILGTRLASEIIHSAPGWGALQMRMQNLEGTTELEASDILRPEIFAGCLVEAWFEAGLSRPIWELAGRGIGVEFARAFEQACKQANDQLAARHISDEMDLRNRMRRTATYGSVPPTGGSRLDTAALAATPDHAYVPAPESGAVAPSAYRPPQGAGAPVHRQPQPGSVPAYRRAPTAAPVVPRYRPTMLWRDAQQETVIAFDDPPAVDAGSAAVPVAGSSGAPGALWVDVGQQLQRYIVGTPVVGTPGAVVAAHPSPALQRAIEASLAPAVVLPAETGARPGSASAAELKALAQQLQQRSSDLKAQAEQPAERATIEIVALMFQTILSEDRIVAAIRIWFARLQLPVLRVALAEPDFFAAVDHPARQLIDRMGACAMGFDATDVSAARLEQEVKRVVQVIEQYPETGRRVFQLMLDDFKKFLGTSLVSKDAAGRAATLAQLIEQREALVVQYTIEVRRMLEPLPVSDVVRDFLFGIWSDVLATAAVRQGARHADTTRHKRTASKLIWSASPQPDRDQRSRLVAQLADLLAALRQGMETVGMKAEEQDEQIKRLKDAIMQAFASRDEGLSSDKLQQFSRSLDALEDVVTDDPEGDMMLDPGVVELMFGEQNAGVVNVISTGGAAPSPGTLERARKLDLGAWFTLAYGKERNRVQYVWHSQRGQLHLFSTGGDDNFLIQTQRLAGYLQAGLLAPLDRESLTERAARQALTILQEQGLTDLAPG